MESYPTPVAPFVPFDEVTVLFTFTPSPEFLAKQDELMASFVGQLMKNVGSIRRPRVDMKQKAKDSDSALIIDILNEPLLVNVDSDSIAVRLNDQSGDVNKLNLLAIYTESLLAASDQIFGARPLLAFQLSSRQVVRLGDKKNWQLMEGLLPGIATGKGMFAKIPGAGSYRLERVDAKWTVLDRDVEYIYDVVAPANDDWSTIWFKFIMRSPEDNIADPAFRTDVRGVLGHVFDGEPVLKSLCEGALVINCAGGKARSQ